MYKKMINFVKKVWMEERELFLRRTLSAFVLEVIIVLVGTTIFGTGANLIHMIALVTDGAIVSFFSFKVPAIAKVLDGVIPTIKKLKDKIHTLLLTAGKSE